MIFELLVVEFHDLVAVEPIVLVVRARAFPASLAFSSVRLLHLYGIFQVLLVSSPALRSLSVYFALRKYCTHL